MAALTEAPPAEAGAPSSVGEPSAAGEASAAGADAETQELENLELGGNGGAESMDAEDETEALSRREPPHRG